MRSRLLIFFVFLAFAFNGYVSAAENDHVMVSGSAVKWADSPHIGPGIQTAVLEGDPSGTGTYTIRLKMPDGFKVPPHWHPVAENLVVLQGDFMIGMGEKFDETALQSLGTGGFSKIPKEMRHFGMSKGETVLQIYGVGPFKIIYVNPEDDPAIKATSK